MKNIIIFSLICTLYADVAAQISPKQQNFINTYITPPINRTNRLFSCIPLVNTNCNYIQNGGFIPNTQLFSLYDPFFYNQVTGWQEAVGSPQIFVPVINSFAYPPPPIGFNSYAMLFGSSPNISEGIAQKIAPLTINQTYNFSFYQYAFNINNSNPPVLIQNYTVVLLKCIDFNNLQNTDYNTPILPAQSQVIYCDNNINPNNAWKKKLVNFTANDNYDIIMLYVNCNTSANNYGVILTTGLQLNKTIASVNITSQTNQTGCIYTVTPECVLPGFTYQWVGPFNVPGTPFQTFTGTSLPIDGSIPTNLGNWTLNVFSNDPIQNSPNNTCSINNPNNALTSLTFNIANCNSTSTPCLNLPLIQ